MNNPTETPDLSSAPVSRPDLLAARLSGILASLSDAILCIDRSWHLTYANAEAMRISRLDPEDFGSKTLWDLFPDLGDELERKYRAAMASGDPDHCLYFYAPFDLWVDINILPTDEGFALHYRDMTARKQSELREQETARHLAEVLEVTSEAVVSFDREWRITFMNTKAKELTGSEDLLGKNMWDEFPAARTGGIWDNCHRTMEEGVTSSFETYYPEPLNAWFAIQVQPAPDGIVVFFRDITEQRNREQTLGQQRELLAAVQQASRLATWELNPKTGRVLYGSGSFAVFGHPLEEITTFEDLKRILLPGHEEKIRTAVLAAARTDSILAIEFAVKAADHSVIWVEARGQTVAAAKAGRSLRGIALDITKQKLDAAEVIASEARYRVLADLNPVAIWMSDAAGRMTYANQRILNYVGLVFEDFVGTGWLQCFHPEDQEQVLTVWTQAFATGGDYDVEARLREAATGKYRYWHVRAAPVRDTYGNILHWLGVAHDIDDRKTYAETLLAEQMATERRRAELETLYKTTPVGHAILDPHDFTYLSLNDREAEMLGLPKEQILGRKMSEIASATDAVELLELLRSVARGNVVRDRTFKGELRSSPGESRVWRINYSPIFNEDGSIRAISTASMEITHQQKAELALIQSEKLAAVGRLASSISHEINNPLEAITNLLYLIALDDQLPKELRNYVQTAQSELSRVSQIATQTLRFHRQAVAPTLVTPAELVKAVLRLYTGRLANSNIQIDTRYNTHTQILCFENDVRQVLNNLIANAIDAMRTGGRLMIRAHEVEAAASDFASFPRDSCKGVRITIADNGHGMSAAVLARVFEPFYTTKDLNGTGLGLWISEGIIARHHGRLRVRSSEDPVYHGTVFTVFLPCNEAGRNQADRPAA